MINLSSNVERKKSLELKKHVGAIHSSNKLTLVQRKVANALLYNAYDNLLKQDRHTIHIRILCDLIGYAGHDYKAIKNSLISLISTVMQWNLVDKNRDEKDAVWNASSIIADASIDGPLCMYSYSHNMRQLLYHPDLYGRINMSVQAKFKSTYGLALYENCIRYQGITQTQWFDLPTFRLLMGVGKDEYPIFRDFKRRVVDKAVSEVNAYAPIYIRVKFKKEGRGVTALQFLIEQQQKLNDSNNSDELPRILSNRLQNDFGFSSIQAEKAINVHGEQYIQDKINLIESSTSFQSGKIINLAKYLEHALKQDYKPPKSSRVRLYEIKQQEGEKAKQQKVEKKKLEEYQNFQDKEILRIYTNEIGIDEKKIIKKDFEKEIQKNVYYSAYLREGLANVLVADRFCNFIRNHKYPFLSNIISFEKYFVLKGNNESKE
jgi:plasmid replication initiation protein